MSRGAGAPNIADLRLQSAKQMLCIFCLNDKPPSEEHVFPEAIGGTLTIDRVCRECNNLLNARADRDLIQHPFVKMRRATLRIPDKRGRTLDPFADVFGTGTIVGDGRGQKVSIRLDPVTRRPTLRLFPHKIEKVGPDGEKEFEYKIDARDAHKLPTILQRERKRLGRPELSPSALDAAVSEVLSRSRTVAETPVIRHQMMLKETDPRRGILKIAYELAWLWLGDEYLHDESAQNLRRVILSDRPIDDPGLPEICGTMSTREAVPALVPWNDVPNVHLAVINAARNRVGIALRVFKALSAVVIVSEQWARYGRAGGRDHVGNFIELDPKSRTVTQSSLAEAIIELCKRSEPILKRPGPASG